MQFGQPKRREFIMLIGGAIWPVAARATERKNAADRAFMPGRLRPHATTQVMGWYREIR